MNRIWAALILIGVAVCAWQGRLSDLSEELLNSASDGLYFVLSLAGVMGLWAGLMNVARRTGLMEKLAGLAAPVMRFLFPKEADGETRSLILMSFLANLFGAGNSSTVFALKAMEALDRENGRRPEASDAMCMFLAVNMTMLQLAPVTILKLRQDAGSADPGAILLPSYGAALLSMAVSVLICKLAEHRRR